MRVDTGPGQSVSHRRSRKVSGDHQGYRAPAGQTSRTNRLETNRDRGDARA